MKKIEFYTRRDWNGNVKEKILNIKSKDLFSEFCGIYEDVPDFSVQTCSFYLDEVEVIKKEIEREKKELSRLPEKRKHGELSAFDFNMYKEFGEERIKKLEELLKKYEIKEG